MRRRFYALDHTKLLSPEEFDSLDGLLRRSLAEPGAEEIPLLASHVRIQSFRENARDRSFAKNDGTSEGEKYDDLRRLLVQHPGIPKGNVLAGGRMRKMKAIGVADDRLLCREIVNNNKFDVVAEMDRNRIPYIRAAGITPGFLKVLIRAGDSAFLYHGFYTFTGVGLPKGEMFDLVIKVGRNIGDGENLPSQPIFDA